MSALGANGHFDITNAASVHPTNILSYTLAALVKIQADLSNLGVALETSFNGGASFDGGYYDGGDNNAYAAKMDAGTPTSQVLASRPGTGVWTILRLDQNGDGGAIRFGWYNFSTLTWTYGTVGTGLALAGLSQYNISVNSNSNPFHGHVRSWRMYNGVISDANLVNDFADGTLLLADVFHYEITGATAGTWTELTGSGATIASQGGSLSVGDSYTYPGRGGSPAILRQMLMHQQH
jgi:hypothetical protein